MRHVYIVVFLSILLLGIQTGTGVADEAASREVRGIWLRPPDNIEDIPAILDDICTAGLNAVFLETFYHGFVIHTSSYIPHRPQYKDTDVLKIFIDEGKKRNIKIHCWIEVFYWMVDTAAYPQFPRTPLFDGHEEWLLRLRDGSTTEKAEGAHIFANPSHPEVQQLLVNYMKELASAYDIAGINIDYIRYPAGQESGYDDFTRAEFKKDWGVDPIDIDKNAEPVLWEKWVAWRENRVTDFVRRLRSALDEVPGDIMLSADIFPNYYESKDSHPISQDWKVWIDLNLVDTIIPMAYAYTLEGIQGQVGLVTSYTEEKETVCFPGLAAPKKTADGYGGPEHPPLPKQIELVRQLGLPGHVIFCYSWVKDSDITFGELGRTAYK